MSEELKSRFDQAAQEVKQLSKAPDNMMLLRLYALYKQAAAGDCAGKRPGLLDMVGRAKYDAWKSLEGMASEEAMQSYIDLVEELKAADKG
jgi:acyl-CoA-binding protein